MTLQHALLRIGVLSSLVFLAYGLWLFPLFSFPADLLLTLLGGGALIGLGAGVRQVLGGDPDRKAVARALRGEPRVDGARVAVDGRLEPRAEPLRSPLGGKPAVFYRYELRRRVAFRKEHDVRQPFVPALAGYGGTPAVVRTGAGDVPVHGFGSPTEFPPAVLDGDPEAAERLAARLAESPPEDVAIRDAVSLARDLDELYRREGGPVRKDVRMHEGPLDLGDGEMAEWVIAPGEPVTVLGVWDAARGVLGPGAGTGFSGVRILPGLAPEASRALSKAPWDLLGFTAALFLLTHLGLFWLVATGLP